MKNNCAYIYINYKNTAVIQKYLEIISEALKHCGYKCEFIKQIDNNINKRDLIVFPTALDAFKYYFKGYKNIGLWQQGNNADESYMKHNSKLRYNMLNFIDCFVMKKAKFILFVSDYMRKHYEKLSHSSFDNKSYVMPCFNEKYDETVFEKKDYGKRVFTYVGSLAVWQCFEETAEIYSQIEKRFPDAFFKVLTFQTDEAKEILEKKGVKNYEVKCVPQEEVNKELLEATYGFVIREDNIVNRVATPTKFSSYLAAGVIPIFSSCLVDFYDLTKNSKYIHAVSNNSDIDEIIEWINIEIDGEEVKAEIKKIFDEYYNENMHIEKISRLIKEVIQ